MDWIYANSTLLGLLSVFVSLVGICMAAYFFQKGQKESKSIQDLLATRPLEIFPNYLTELAKMIEGAQSRIDVLCAYPQHGAYSSPRCWRGLEDAIEKVIKERNVTIRLIFSNSEQRIAADFNQFDTAVRDWKGWSRANEKNLRKYLKSHLSVCEKNEINPEAPEKALEQLEDWLWFQDECEKDVMEKWRLLSGNSGGNASILESGDLMPLFAWVIDKDREAIFTFMTYNHHGIGAAFRTTDKRIVDNLFSLVERYQRRSEAFNLTPLKRDKGREKVQSIRDSLTLSRTGVIPPR